MPEENIENDSQEYLQMLEESKKREEDLTREIEEQRK